jgi:hypothetical protein
VDCQRHAWRSAENGVNNAAVDETGSAVEPHRVRVGCHLQVLHTSCSQHLRDAVEEPRPPAGPRFTPRPLPPDKEITAQLARGVGEATWRYRARVIVHAPAAHVRSRLPIPVEVEAFGENKCAFEPGSDHPEMLALYLGMLDADFIIVGSPELVDVLRKLTRRYQSAIDSSQQAPG